MNSNKNTIRPNKSPQVRHGFSLVELLVVIAIIALLMSILLPSLRMARDQGFRAVCGTRQNQLYIGLAMYGNDFKAWNPTLRWYQSMMTGNMNNGVGMPPPLGSVGHWLREYCQIRVVTDQSNYASIRTLGHTPADKALISCPSARLRESNPRWFWSTYREDPLNPQKLPPDKWQSYKYQQFSFLFTGLGSAGFEHWPANAVDTIKEWGSTRLSHMNGEGAPIAIFQERFFAAGPKYNSHFGKGVNVTGHTGSVQWVEGGDIPMRGYYGGWVSHKYWIQPFWGVVSQPKRFEGPYGMKNMMRQYGYKKYDKPAVP